MILDFGDDSSKSISLEVNKAFSTISNLGLPLLNIIPSFNKIVIIFENSEIIIINSMQFRMVHVNPSELS